MMAILMMGGCHPSSDDLGNGTPDRSDTEQIGEPTSPPDTPGVPEEPVKQEASLTLASGSGSGYRVIYPEGSGAELVAAAEQFTADFAKQTGAQIAAVSDQSAAGEKEIIVGLTSRPESGTMQKRNHYLGYEVRILGDKLAVFGYTAEGLSKGLTHILRSMEKQNDSFVYSGENNVRGSISKVTEQLPVYPSGTLEGLYHCGDGVWEVSIKSTKLREYTAYLDLVRQAGYTLYTENELATNRFATYVNEAYSIHLAYYPNLSVCKIIAEPKGYLPALEAEPYERTVQSSFAQVAMTYRGLKLVFQLADGSFIIVDGGDKNETDLQTFYEYLSANRQGEKIRIAAWFFTHSHNDHMDNALEFLKRYHDEVTVELFAYNFPDPAAVEGCKDYRPGCDLVTRGTQLKAIRNQYYRDAAIWKFHTGQKLYLRDAEIEFLYTQEDLYPGTFTWGNHTSAGFRINIGGTGIMVLGDMETACHDRISRCFGTYLKSDIMQCAHHGYNAGTLQVYQLIRPDVCIWACPEDRFNGNDVRKYVFNQWVIENAKEHYNFSKTTVLPLPYQVK